MLNPGNYKAKAVNAALGESSQGNPQVAVEFELQDPDFVGQKITWFGSFSDKAFEFTIKALRTCGWTGVDLDDLSGIGENEVSLVVEHETYEGKTSAKVRWVNPVGGLALKAPMSPEKAKSFATQMKGRILAFDKSNGSARKPAPKSRPSHAQDPRPEPPSEVTYGADDDIPF